MKKNECHYNWLEIVGVIFLLLILGKSLYYCIDFWNKINTLPRLEKQIDADTNECKFLNERLDEHWDDIEKNNNHIQLICKKLKMECK
jgi:hypothetical protein